MIKTKLLMLGLMWSGGLLTASTFKAVDLGSDRDFYLGVFSGCTMGLGLSKVPTSNKSNGNT